MKETILHKIPAECPWRDTLYWYDTIDSTNTAAKQLARNGAPHGTVLMAGAQTAGRGRMGRVFQSQCGGAYLTVILRPGCTPEKLMHLTCAVAVAMTEAIKAACGFEARIKWINDLVWEHRKIGGILTETALDSKTGLVDYAIVGIGINCQQQAGDMPSEIRHMAASLSMAAGRTVLPSQLLPEMVTALYRMSSTLLTDKARTMDLYRSRCVTLGSSVQVLRNGQATPATALDIDCSGGLLVEYSNGCRETVSSGEVSVRGFYDYV